MLNKQYLLPLNYASRMTTSSVGASSSRRSISLNEKTLIVILLVSTIVTFFVILNNLPTQVSLRDEAIKELFVPRLAYEGEIIHGSNNHHVDHRRIDTAKKKKVKEFEASSLSSPNQAVIHPIEPPAPGGPSIEERREKIKSMTLFAWNSYKQYAWGKNELKPLSKTGHTPGIFGQAHDLGATIVDGLDTLYLMGFKREFDEGTEWIRNNFNISIDAELSFFEVNIRFIGGFLSLYTLTKDKLFLDKAVEVADAFLPVFDSPTGISYSLFNPIRKTKRNYAWASGSCSILSEFGSLSLEFKYLSDLTGNPIYQAKIEKIYRTLDRMKKKDGIYYNYVNPQNGTWCSSHAGLAGLGDSFYEYLLKYWLYKDRKDARILKMYLSAMEAVRNKLVAKSSGGLTYLDEYVGSFLAHKMGHLACFTGGLFALTAIYVDELAADERYVFRSLATEITHTCHESYTRTATRIGPESFSFKNGAEAEPLDSYYILRPEVIEAYFYMWRMTKDEKYRDWAWDAAEAIERHCRTDSGYSGLKDVRFVNSVKDDVQQSFFFAETLKYLFLIFSDDDVLPLDKFVLNTEAHPFLIPKS